LNKKHRHIAEKIKHSINMKKMYTIQKISRIMTCIMLFAALIFFSANTGFSQSKTFPTGSYIVNMGVVPQTMANGLKPYGLIYDLIKNYDVPVYWIIGDSKLKDGVDFNYNGVDYKGGTFIISKDNLTTAVAARITFFAVTGAYTVGPLTLTTDYILKSVPTWTLDDQNGQLAQPYFANAGIPANSYNWLAPSALGACNDIFVMPHADPTWAVHGNLYNWNLQYKGSIWTGCHAGSALANTYNPADISQQMNFLMTKVDRPGFNPVLGGTSYCENSLYLWTHHVAGSLPYNTLTGGVPNGTLATAQDPVAQYMGISDLAHQNGSEQVYLPVAGGAWLPSTQIICYDPTQANMPPSPGTAVIIAYGRAFGNTNRGYVMVEAAHSLNKGTAGDVPAQRAFFNWSFLSTIDKVPIINSITGVPPGGVFNAQPYPRNYPLTVSYTSPVSSGFNSVTWTCTRADNGASVGTFIPNGTLAATSTVFTPPNTLVNLTCNLTVKVVDVCGRSTLETIPNITISGCTFSATAGTITPPSCNGGTNGSIAINFSNGTAPYNWTWTRTNPAGGPTSGSGSPISGLAAGTYNVTVTDANGCVSTFSALVNQPALLAASTVITQIACSGGTGAIDLTVTGGTAPYSYDWDNDGLENPDNDPQDLSGLTAGTYTVIVTDSKGCTVTKSATLNAAPSGLDLTATQINVSCYGGSNGSIDLSVSGGTGPYTYDWADLTGTNDPQDRSGLAAGTYSVTVTDANGCTGTLQKTITQPAALALSVSITNPTCAALSPPTYTVFDGAINLTVTGGTPPYTYDWADLTPPPAETEDRTALGPGTYSVTVTDSKGCTASTSATLINTSSTPPPPAGINH
jgi:hypothetical protein